MKINNIVVFYLLFSLLIPVAHAELVQEPARQREVLDIAARLRCAVCQSQSVAESDSDLANDMKAIIGEQLDQGEDSEQIINYFVERYGDYILMSPRTDGVGWLLWWLPVAIIGLVLLLVGWQVRLRANASAASGATAPVMDSGQKRRLQELRREPPTEDKPQAEDQKL